MKLKKALITGITGQDGSYLAEFLLKKNYIVHGIKRKSSSFNTSRIDHIYENKKNRNNFYLHYGDLLDSNSLTKIINKIKPNEIYNFAAQSHVGVSFDLPNYTAQVNSIGTLNLLQAIHDCGLTNSTKFYQASTSELFGEIQETKQSEKTKFYPKSPYATSKLFAYWITKNYRESYKMFASNGILFNHESPRRGLNFVTRKITHSLARILRGYEKKINLGDISTRRDWGHSKDYVRAIWLILQHKEADDFVISTGKNYSIKDFLIKVFKILDLDWKKYVTTNNKKFLRPAEVRSLKGDSSKARKLLKWKPQYNLDDLCKDMLISDLKLYGMSLEDAKKIAVKLSNK